jgi:hypothetical protein
MRLAYTAIFLGVLTSGANAVAASSFSGVQGHAGGPSVAVAPVTVAQATTALELEARQLKGSEAIYVTGHTTPNDRLTLSLYTTISSDLPDVLVNRHFAAADANGRFGAVIPIASAFQRGTLLRVTAVSATGATGDAHLTMDAPNAGIAVPFDPH